MDFETGLFINNEVRHVTSCLIAHADRQYFSTLPPLPERRFRPTTLRPALSSLTRSKSPPARTWTGPSRVPKRPSRRGDQPLVESARPSCSDMPISSKRTRTKLPSSIQPIWVCPSPSAACLWVPRSRRSVTTQVLPTRSTARRTTRMATGCSRWSHTSLLVSVQAYQRGMAPACLWAGR